MVAPSLLVIVAFALICPSASDGQIISIIVQDGIGFSGVMHVQPLRGDNVTLSAVDKWPPGFSPGDKKFSAACWRESRLWFSPRDGPGVVALDASSGNMTAHFALGLQQSKFVGCAVGSQFIALGPFATPTILQFDTSVTPPRTRAVDRPNCCVAHGVVYASGSFYMAPFMGTCMAILNETDNTVSSFFLDVLPGVALGIRPFIGIVSTGSSAWLVPHTASAVVQFHFGNKTATVHSQWPAEVDRNMGSKFAGGTYDGAAWVYLAPTAASALVRVHISSGLMEAYPNFPAEVTFSASEKFLGAVWDGRNVYLAPMTASHLVRFEPPTKTMRAFGVWPKGFASGPHKFHGFATDGVDLFLVPIQANMIVRIGSGRPTSKSTSASRSSSLRHPRRTATMTNESSFSRSSTATSVTLLSQTPTTSTRLSASGPTLSASLQAALATASLSCAASMLPPPFSPTITAVGDVPRSTDRRTVVITTTSDAVLQAALGDSGVAAAAGASGATVVIGAMFAPTTSTRLPRVSATTSVLACGLSTDEPQHDADAKPSMIELPLHPAVGTRSRRFYAGGALVASSALAVLKLISIMMTPRSTKARPPDSHTRLAALIGSLTAAVEAYFASVICFAATTVLANEPDWHATAAAAFSGLVAIGSVSISVAFANQASIVAAQSKLWEPYIEGTRDRTRALSRNFYAAEQSASISMAIISGSRPDSHCEAFAAILVLLMLLYVVYVIGVRPYASRLDLGFSLLVGVLQLALGLACLLHLRGLVSLSTVGFISIAIFVVALVQTLALSVDALLRSERRRVASDSYSQAPMLIVGDPSSSSSCSSSAPHASSTSSEMAGAAGPHPSSPPPPESSLHMQLNNPLLQQHT